MIRCFTATLLGLATLLACDSGSPAERELSLRFAPMIGARAFACGSSFDGVGTADSTVTPLDFRMYVRPPAAAACRTEADAMSPAAQRGMAMFFSERAECYHCHAGPNFSTSFRSATTEAGPPDFQNNGLYSLDASGAYPGGNGGLYEFSGDLRDQGKFRVPTLRNIAVTAPYMHDGSLATLAEVIDHYAAGGTEHLDGPHAGDGRANPNKSALVRPFELSEEERDDLIAFLESLTDPGFLADPRFGPPTGR